MKILLVLHQNPDGYPAGIEQYMLDLIQGLSFRGLDISLFFPEKKSLKLRHYNRYSYEELLFEGGFIDFTQLEDERTDSTFADILDKTNPDIVHFQGLRSLPLSIVKAAKQKDKKVVISVHDYFLWCVHFILMRPAFCEFEEDINVCHACLKAQGFQVDKDFIINRHRYIGTILDSVDALICPSYYVKEKLLERYPFLAPAKCEVMELGVRKEYFQRNVQNEQKHVDSILRVGFLGNFLPHKGSKVFLQILEEFKSSPQFEFHIFGNIYDPIIKDYPNLRKFGGYTRTHICEILNNQKIDVNLLLSTVPETFSYTLTESVASGIPVIAHDIGALRERASRLRAGFLVPYENSVHYIKFILMDIFNNREILDYFKKNCEQSAQAILSVDDMTQAHYSFYSKIVSSPSSTVIKK